MLSWARRGKRIAIHGLILGALVGSGCGTTSAAERETTLPTAKKLEAKTGPTQRTPDQMYKDELARGDALFEQRDDRKKLEAAIAAYQSAAKTQPAKVGAWVRLSRATYLLADGFMSFDKESSDEAMKTFLAMHERGIVYAKRALLAYSPGFQKRMQAGTKMEDAVDSLDKGAVPALYWFSTNYGKWAVAKGFTTILKYKDMIRKVMEHVLKLDPEFFHGAADRYFGAFFAKAPSFAGGDMDKSKAHFEASLKRAPYYLGTKVLMAAYWAKKKDDRALFEKLLKEVIAANADKKKEVGPENRIEQKKARRLMAKIDDIF